MTEDSKIPAPLLEKPHHLFRPEKDYSKMMVVPETVELLKQIKTPVVIVTIVGTQRGGKSTLLNLLHSRKTAGFGLGHFMDPCTTGLWIWCRPHPRDPDLTVILMDTEGLDSPHVPQWYNWTLSALALLISTYFIYQTKGSIDSNATDRLGVILKVAEQLRGGIDDKTDKPEFLWLIRDHQLAMKKAPKSEMTDKLDGGSLKALQRCFSDYDCVPLPRPVDKDELLKEVEKLSWDELRSEFREEYVVLERSIFNLIARPRSLSGRPITGDVIASLVSKYAASISGKDGILTSLSQLPTQRQMVVKLAGERAVTVAFQEYANKINELLKDKFPVSDTGLAEAHQKAYEESLKIFQNEANIEDMKNLDADLEEYLAQYNKHINDWQLISTVLDGECVMVQKLVGGYYYQIWKKNIDVSKKHCHDELAALYSPLSQKVKQADFPSIQDFYKEVEAIKSTYRSSDKATGSAKQLVQVEFFESKISSDAEVVSEALMRKEFTTKDESLKSELIKHFQDAIKQQEEAFKQQLQTQATQYEAKLESLSNSLKQAAEDTNKSFAAQKNATEELGKQLGEKISTINDKIHQIEVPVALHTQQLQTVGTSVEAIQTELKGLPQLQTRVETLDVKFSSKIEQNEKNIADVDKKIDAKSEDLKQAISSHVNDTTSKLLASETSLKEKLEAANTTHQSAQSQLQQSLSQQADQIKTTATQLEAEKEKIKSLEQQLQQTSSQTNQKVEEVGQSLKDLVAESSKKLDEKVAHSTTESKTQLEAVKSTIETNVSSIQQQLQTQLNEHQQSIQQYRTTSTSEMATLTQSLKQQSDHVLTTTTTQVDEAVSRVRLELSNGLKISEEKTTQLVAELKTALETRSDSLKQDTESKVTSITTELASWKQTAQSQNDAILSQLSQLTEQAKKDIAGLSQQYEEKINSLVQQTQSMASSSTQAAAFQQAIEERARLLENVANELKSQYQSLITSTNSSQEQLRSENQKLTSTVQHLSSQLDSLAQVNTALKSLEADFQKKVAEIALNQEQLGSNYKVKIDEGIRSLTTRCAANEQLIDAFRKNLEQLQTSLVSSKQLADTVSQVDQKLNGLQAELKKMRDVSTAANEASKSVDHLKHSLDAIWESIGVLSGRIVNVEALVDKNN